MERLEDCISFLAGKAVQQITRRAREKLAPHGVTPVQYAVLKVLWEQDGQSGAELGARIVLDSASITGIADRLEFAGLLERRSTREDRRVQRLFLTKRGRSLRTPLDKAMDDLNVEAREAAGSTAGKLWQGLARLGDTTAWRR